MQVTASLASTLSIPWPRPPILCLLPTCYVQARYIFTMACGTRCGVRFTSMNGDKVDEGGCVNTLTVYKPTALAKGNGTHSMIVQVAKA